jgi:hypothetical protein
MAVCPECPFRLASTEEGKGRPEEGRGVAFCGATGHPEAVSASGESCTKAVQLDEDGKSEPGDGAGATAQRSCSNIRLYFVQ